MDTEQGILISGASGFVGSYLTQYFNKPQCSIIPLSRGGKFTYNSLDENSNIEVATYIHLAGESSDDDSLGENHFWEANVNLTERLFTHFLSNKEAKCFVFMSSIKAFDHKVQGVLTEDNLGHAAGFYGASKRAAEDKIRELYEGYLREGGNDKSVVILRPCLIHGPGNQGNLRSLYGLVEKGIPYPFSAFKTIRSYLHVENLAFAIRQIDELKPPGLYKWFIADDEPVATNEVLDIASAKIGKRAFKLFIPAFIWKTGFFLSGLVSRKVNIRLLEKITEGTIVSNEKILSELGLSGFPLTSREGLADTFASFAIKN